MDSEQRKMAIFGGVALLALLAAKRMWYDLFPPDKQGPGDDSETPGGEVTPAPENEAPATLTAVQAGIICDAIEEAIWGSGLFGDMTEDEDAVIEQLERCQNDADLRLLLNIYGERGTMLDKYSLVATIHEFLSSADIAAINSDYNGKGISLLF